MKKIYYNKVIRDRVADKMSRNGVRFLTKKLSQKAFEKALILKVAEEASGVVNAKNRQELVQELADLLVVIDEVKRVKKISPLELKKTYGENMAKKGGFSKKLWLIWSEDSGYKTNEKTGK